MLNRDRSARLRRRRAAAWAGKPSWSARATIDGAIRASARSSARAIAVRLRNASTVMPLDTSAKPDVGSDAGQPITKFAALNGVCWPTRISPALTSPSTTSSTSCVGDGDLEVLGRVAVGDGDRLGEVVDEHAAAVRPRATPAPRRPGPSGSSASWRASSASVASASAADVVDEHDRRVGAVLGLDQQVGGQPDRVGGAVGDHQALGRAEQHHRRHAVALQLDLGARRRRASPGPTTLRTVGIDSVPNAEGGDARPGR